VTSKWLGQFRLLETTGLPPSAQSSHFRLPTNGSGEGLDHHCLTPDGYGVICLKDVHSRGSFDAQFYPWRKGNRVRRRSLVALTAFAGFTGCASLLLGSADGYLPLAFGRPRVIFDSGLGDYFFIYELNTSTIARISAESLMFEGFHAPPRSNGGWYDFAKGMHWFQTPMFTMGPSVLHRRLRADAAEYLGIWAERLEGYAIGTNGHKLSLRANEAYATLRAAIEKPGNYFGFGSTSEAFGIVDVGHRLMLLTRGEI